MGTWAVGSFENDHALDWLAKVHESEDFSLIRAALTGDFERAPSRVSVEAIAAADLVACSLGHPPPEPKRQKLVAWTQQHAKAFTPDLVELARKAVRVIGGQSELRELWKDRYGIVNSEWLASLDNLEKRLRG